MRFRQKEKALEVLRESRIIMERLAMQSPNSQKWKGGLVWHDEQIAKLKGEAPRC
jgi:hypothetical protein